MKKVAIIVLDGFEEIEALFPVDILRRAKLQVDILTVNEDKKVKGSHNILLTADNIIENVDFSSYDAIILPGGPGTKNYEKYDRIKEVLIDFNNKNKLIAAICAAPFYLSKLGILKNKQATVYPSFEKEIQENEAIFIDKAVIKTENIITARSIAAACDFGLEILKHLLSNSDYENMKKELIY